MDQRRKMILTGTTIALFSILLGAIAAILAVNNLEFASKILISGKQDHEKERHDEHGEEAHQGERAINFSQKELDEFGIEVATAGPGKLEISLDLTGEVIIDPDREAHITPRVPGIVKEVEKKLGDIVKKDEVLAILESPRLAQVKIEYLNLRKDLDLAQVDLERAKTVVKNTKRLLALLKDSLKFESIHQKVQGLDMGKNRSRLLSAYAAYIFSRETYKREKKLQAQKISSRADFLIAESEYKKAEANYIATYDEISFAVERLLYEKKRSVSVAKSALLTVERRLHALGLSDKDIESLKNQTEGHGSLGRVELRVPFVGTVTQKHITLGEFLGESDIPFVVADLSSVWIYLTVYQKDLSKISVGQKVSVCVSQKEFCGVGKIDYVSPIVEEKSRTTTARVIFENPEGLWKPGLFVTARVVTKELNIPIIVPKTAIQNIEDRSCIFVKDKDGFEPKVVSLGRSNHEYIEILSGLKPGWKYVAKGGFTLKSQLGKAEFSEGHEH